MGELRAPEGAITLKDGSVLVVELKAGALTGVAPDGKKEVVAEVGGAPNGAAIGPDGKVYICNNGGLIFAEMSGRTLPIPGLPSSYKGGSIQRVDLANGSVETIYTGVTFYVWKKKYSGLALNELRELRVLGH
jgi:gluconolactonase